MPSGSVGDALNTKQQLVWADIEDIAKASQRVSINVLVMVCPDSIDGVTAQARGFAKHVHGPLELEAEILDVAAVVGKHLGLRRGFQCLGCGFECL